MKRDDAAFQAFSGFIIDDILAEQAVARRMPRRLEDAGKSITPAPTTSAVRTAPASTVVAHAVVELETQLIELQK